jgi:hypothetical protein
MCTTALTTAGHLFLSGKTSKYVHNTRRKISGCHQFVIGTDAERYELLHNRSVTYNNEVQCKQENGRDVYWLKRQTAGYTLRRRGSGLDTLLFRRLMLRQRTLQHLFVNSVTGCKILDLCLLDGKLLSHFWRTHRKPSTAKNNFLAVLNINRSRKLLQTIKLNRGLVISWWVFFLTNEFRV